MQKPLPEKIRELRKKRKYTLEQLAQKAGCSKSYISQLEKGKTVPSVSMLGRLAAALDSQVSELLSENSQDFQWDWHLRKPERRIIQYPDGKVTSELLTRGVFQKKSWFWKVKLTSGSASITSSFRREIRYTLKATRLTAGQTPGKKQPGFCSPGLLRFGKCNF
ncbi:MAG: helix-turn-helix transcriptional regulator [Deltaproteobacteria bacterium]